jgi:hypothetical protein
VHPAQPRDKNLFAARSATSSWSSPSVGSTGGADDPSPLAASDREKNSSISSNKCDSKETFFTRRWYSGRRSAVQVAETSLIRSESAAAAAAEAEGKATAAGEAMTMLAAGGKKAWGRVNGENCQRQIMLWLMALLV